MRNLNKVYRRNLALSSRPSTLLMQALEDLEWIERHPARYVVRMANWHFAADDYWNDDSKGRCEVCLAGATIACRDGVSWRETTDPWEFPGSTQDKLFALDHLRRGNIFTALRLLGKYKECLTFEGDYEACEDIPNYHDDRKGWWDAMIALVGALRSEGL